MIPLSRRRFMAGAAGAALAAAVRPAFSGVDVTRLQVATRQLEVNGKAATVFEIRQPGGVHGLFTEAGSDFAVRLENDLAEPTLVHWHGLTPPWRQDGVPDISQDALNPGASYDYRFVNNRAGTHWMHSHVGLQEQELLAAPLIVRDPAERGLDEQEVVILLHDFSFKPADEIMAGLKGEGHGGESGTGMGDMSSMSSMGDMSSMMSGMAKGTMESAAQGAMPGMEMDINDVEYDAYLANDRTLDDPEVVAVEGNGQVRLRIINGATSTNFTIDLGELQGELIAVDGNPVRPVRGSRFPIGIAQRADIRLVIPAGGRAYPVLVLREGAMERTGIILRPKGAGVAKLASMGTETGPVLDLGFERGLRALAPISERPADRRVALDLTGKMTGYAWGLAVDGEDGAKIPVKRGERVEMVMRNRTMMSHPMHLHGHHFQVVGIGGQRLDGALRDTVLVPPMTQVTVAFDADNAGRWAFHCHNLYHAAVGMFTTVEYENVA